MHIWTSHVILQISYVSKYWDHFKNQSFASKDALSFMLVVLWLAEL